MSQSHASVRKGVVCSECGSPMWEILNQDGVLEGYCCLNGHFKSQIKDVINTLAPPQNEES